jgi:hypothetical protein
MGGAYAWPKTVVKAHMAQAKRPRYRRFGLSPVFLFAPQRAAIPKDFGSAMRNGRVFPLPLLGSIEGHNV